MELSIPRDRNGAFDPVLVPKHQRRLAGLDEKILAMYARGTSVRDISAQIEELYGATVSASLISEVTDAVSEEVKAWQSRPLDELYPIVYLDALYVNIKVSGRVKQTGSVCRFGASAGRGKKRCWDCGLGKLNPRERSSG